MSAPRPGLTRLSWSLPAITWAFSNRRYPDRVRARGASIALLAMFIAGCADVPGTPTPTAKIEPPAPYACLLPSEERMLVAELFFGRNIKGRAPLSDAEWAGFAADVITPNFPDGFTVFDGYGQWQNPKTGQIAHDPTKILL